MFKMEMPSGPPQIQVGDFGRIIQDHFIGPGLINKDILAGTRHDTQAPVGCVGPQVVSARARPVVLHCDSGKAQLEK
jgi:hypothetical protein